MAKGQYTKLYHVLMDEYPSVWRSDAQLALFVRLLMHADKWWPQWVPIGPGSPIGLRNGAYQSLLRAGLVLERAGVGSTPDRYTVLGLDKERRGRSEHGRYAASMRWADAPSNAQPMPSKAEESKEEQSTPDKSNGAPQVFMGFRPKEKPEPGVWGGASTHDGRHGKTCMVCFPPKVTP